MRHLEQDPDPVATHIVDHAIRAMKRTGTGLQIIGCVILALNLSWSGWAYPPMLGGSVLWLVIAIFTFDGALCALNVAFVVINIIGISRWLL